jgi:hypothetical protein
MPHFVYSVPGEPELERMWHKLGFWTPGEKREFTDEAQIEWLRRHPHFTEVEPRPPEPEVDPEDKSALMAALDERGVPYDGRWGVARLQALLEESK